MERTYEEAVHKAEGFIRREWLGERWLGNAKEEGESCWPLDPGRSPLRAMQP